MSILEIRVPDIGGHDNVNVAEVYVKVGDKINIDDNLIMLETDKATMEVPADKAGVVTEVLVQVGSKLNEGDIVVKVQADGAAVAAAAPVTQAAPVATAAVAPQAAATPAAQSGEIECDVMVLGAGPGGYTAAFRAADLGLKVVLVEKHATLGGVCLNVGCIPSKALLHVAKVINEADEMGHHGVSFGKPSLDIDKIREFKSGVVGKLTKGLDGLAKQRKVEKIQGMAKFTSPYTIEIDTAEGKKVVRFKNAIIASGSHSFKVPGFPFDDPRVIDSTGALLLESVPEKMLVVGGGIIGLEMAEVYGTLGSKITVVELGDGLIPGADRDVVKVLENRIKKRYDAILTKTKCAKVEPKADGLWVTFEGPSAPAEPQKFDKVLVAAGRRPNGKTIGADAAGVIVNEQGFIPADKQQRTNVAHIYAIGDVIGQPMLAHKAVHEGRVAAENCAGMKSFFDARVIPGIAYTDPEVAWVGVTELEAKAQGLQVEVGKFPWAASGRALGNGRDDGFTKIITDKNTHRIIGAAIVGAGAGELLAETCLAIEMDCDIHDVALTVHAHPTLSESVAFACEIVDGSITDLYMPKKKK
ncbi:MAG: dihydrolipoyl dehydrogenase [Burkholderiales bacterium]|nr:dihydrolipoyl dehydrogenase [Burkholderiales bacterium]